ncbi:HEAT repeat domain-containing protein [Myxococcus sp. CA039A]|uniref:HEAT repeat domain-containing protein n=1 Tax=Myxococcus sp. CA039A TaxID=2741737 RepID=UPI00157BB231|nr:HEAT repeat domain-containing protein [Myxococcus sp. CA039A]NTX54458.1 HEAT repeat domain-containing protein [Myxococcus sp. CA039A]
MSFALIIAFTTTLALGSAPTPDAREPLTDLLDRFQDVAHDDSKTDDEVEDSGIQKERQALATAIQAHGAAAIPPLLAMLDSDKVGVRVLAGYTLGDIEGLTEQHLEPLIEAQRQGTPWVERAIGHIGTPRALAFLTEALDEYPSRYNQLTGALETAGGKGALALTESLRAPKPRKPAYVDVACELLREMKDKASPAIEPLLAVMAEEKTHPKNQVHAIRLLGCIGFLAQPAADRLEQFREKTPRLKRDIDLALISIRPELTAALFAQQLRVEPTIPLLRDLAKLRQDGRGAGGALVELLTHENWEIRVAAVHAMGYLQYTDATDLLIAQLNDEKDWRMVIVSVEALGKFKAQKAVGPLERVAKEHWYPFVRKGALQAIKVIRGEATYTEDPHFPSEFLHYRFSVDDTPNPVEPPFVPGSDELSEKDLKPLKYPMQVRTRAEKGWRVQNFQAEPGCGLRVANGHLLGTNRGEWGGELVHRSAKRATTVLLKENTRSIHRIGDTLVAVTGLAHLSSHRGMLYRIVPKGDSYVAEPWRALPGSPKVAGTMEDGRLFISCAGGDVIVTPDGTLEMSTRESRRARPVKPSAP